MVVSVESSSRQPSRNTRVVSVADGGGIVTSQDYPVAQAVSLLIDMSKTIHECSCDHGDDRTKLAVPDLSMCRKKVLALCSHHSNAFGEFEFTSNEGGLSAFLAAIAKDFLANEKSPEQVQNEASLSSLGLLDLPTAPVLLHKKSSRPHPKVIQSVLKREKSSERSSATLPSDDPNSQQSPSQQKLCQH
eukprot:Sro1954_g307590.1 n/a (189) ;mRNA; r:2023-2665